MSHYSTRIKGMRGGWGPQGSGGILAVFGGIFVLGVIVRECIVQDLKQERFCGGGFGIFGNGGSSCVPCEIGPRKR